MLKSAQRLRISVLEQRVLKLLGENASLRRENSELSSRKSALESSREKAQNADSATQTDAEQRRLYDLTAYNSRDAEITTLKTSVGALSAQLHTRDEQLRDVLQRAEAERSAFAETRRRLERAVARKNELERIVEEFYE